MDTPSNRCIECTADAKAIWSIFKEEDDWNKYTSNISDSGGFKTVYIHPKEDYVFKLIKPGDVDVAIRSGLLSEITFPIYINKYGSEFLAKHTPRIIKYFKTKYNDKWALGILEEKAKGISLSKYIEKSRHVSIKEAIHIACQGFEYINDLHHLHIPHLDIKPENMIYDNKTNKLTFIDFGLSCTTNCCKSKDKGAKFREQCTNTFTGGTPGFICPGVFTAINPTPEKRYSYDVYALTMAIISIMPSGYIVRNNLAQSCHRVLHTRLPSHLEHYKNNISVSIKDFVENNQTKNEKNNKFFQLLGLIIIDSKGNLRSVYPTAGAVLSQLNPKYCAVLDLEVTLALQESSIGLDDWVLPEEELITPEEYAKGKFKEIEENQPSLWNVYGFWK